MFADGSVILDDDMTFGGLSIRKPEYPSAAEREHKLRDAVAAAAKADKVVLAIGEHAGQSGEGASRAEITIPECQQKLLEEVYKVNQNIIVVLFNGRPLDLRRVEKYAKAILEVWFPGTEGGNAIADVLFGDVVPSGHLSMSFPWCVGQVPVFYNEFSTGRPLPESGAGRDFCSAYLDIPNRPFYPFGYGLSYTSFRYGIVVLDQPELYAGEVITAAVTVENTGDVAGTEMVQLYIQDVKGSVVRPVRELKGIQKIELQPGEQREVMFSITEEMLRFHNIDMEYTSEPGDFIVYIGSDSTTSNQAGFRLVK